jgi:hypothetical protein
LRHFRILDDTEAISWRLEEANGQAEDVGRSGSVKCQAPRDLKDVAATATVPSVTADTLCKEPALRGRLTIREDDVLSPIQMILS